MAKKVVTFGELLMRLSPEEHKRFIQADSFGVVYGGAECCAGRGCSSCGVECCAGAGAVVRRGMLCGARVPFMRRGMLVRGAGAVRMM